MELKRIKKVEVPGSFTPKMMVQFEVNWFRLRDMPLSDEEMERVIGYTIMTQLRLLDPKTSDIEKWDTWKEIEEVPVMIGDRYGDPEFPTEFAVVVTDFEDKLSIIKKVYTFGYSLKESKDLIEDLPCVVRQGVSLEEAQQTKAILEQGTGVVKIR